MAEFIIVIDENQEAVKERLIRKYKDHYLSRDNDKIFFVRVNSTSEEICRELGIKVDNGDERVAAGAVLKLNASYSGYTDTKLWDWLSSEE